MIVKNIFLLVLLIMSYNAKALPIDWNGEFRFDTFRINDYRRTSEIITDASKDPGSAQISGNESTATLQSYLLKLNPTIIVNDSVSIKGELSSGFARGGFFGDNTTQDGNGIDGTSLPGNYHFTTSNVDNGLIINQLYGELYADTATYRIGRFAKHWGLGVMFNDGAANGSRFFTLYDGFEAEFRLGNFTLTPHWARLGQDANGLTRAQEVRDIGVEAVYDNPNKNIQVGFLFSNRKSGEDATYLEAENGNKNTGSNVRIMDFYLKKSWETFDFAVEVPVLSGDIADAYNDGNTAKQGYDASAYIIQATYKPTTSWDLYLHAGQISGDDGETETFEAMYMHPNFSIANIMFTFNNAAVENASGNFFYSPISNVTFYKLGADYSSGSWKWKLAYIMATAVETASAGRQAYNHDSGVRFNGTQDQNDSYGSEVDLGFEYMWNPGVMLSGDFGYMLTGDFYSFTNTAETQGLEDPMYLAMALSILF